MAVTGALKRSQDRWSGHRIAAAKCATQRATTPEPKKPDKFLWKFGTGRRFLPSATTGKGLDGTEAYTDSSPAIGSDGTVYVGSSDKKFYALDGKTGTKKWEFVTGSYVGSSPAIGNDGTLYIGSLYEKVYALKTDSKGPAKSPWPMRGQNPQRTGRTPKK